MWLAHACCQQDIAPGECFFIDQVYLLISGLVDSPAELPLLSGCCANHRVAGQDAASYQKTGVKCEVPNRFGHLLPEKYGQPSTLQKLHIDFRLPQS